MIKVKVFLKMFIAKFVFVLIFSVVITILLNGIVSQMNKGILAIIQTKLVSTGSKIALLVPEAFDFAI